METSFSELKCKQVINVVDGKNLGKIVDIVLDVKTCKVLGLVVPNPSCNVWSLFKSGKDVFIPFNCICKIGTDVILVELYIEDRNFNYPNCPPPPKPKNCTFTLNQDEYKIK